MARAAVERSSGRTPPRIGIVIADRAPIVLSGLRHVFESEPDIRILEECNKVTDLPKLVRQWHPEIVIVDGDDAFGWNSERVAELKKIDPALRVIVFSGNVDEQGSLDAIGDGAGGFLLKDMPVRLIVECVRKVHQGGLWIERSSAVRALEKLMVREQGMRSISSLLTRREIEVLEHVALGVDNREISRRLFISYGTVKMHVHSIHTKLGTHSRLDLVDWARNSGIGAAPQRRR